MPDLIQSLQDSLPGLSAAGLFLLFFFGTFVSEDAACLLAGTAAASGQVSYAFAVAACLLGIFAGDVLLYWAGRLAGQRIFEHSFVRRFVSDDLRAKAIDKLNGNTAAAVFISRFVSGLRLPTYLAAGAVKADFGKFAFWFLAAAAVWTPVLVGSTAFSQRYLFSGNLILGVVTCLISIRLAIRYTSRRNRRVAIGKLKRIVNWEFWPVQVFYVPVVIYVLWLGIRHRSLTVFTAANPAIPAGGFKGESKHEIYNSLRRSPAANAHLLAHILLPNEFSAGEKMRLADRFIDSNALTYPLAVKPDAGERGFGVTYVHDRKALETAINATGTNLILQEYADGLEVSIFYYRYPSDERGRIFSMTEKRFPVVTGDGTSTVEQLILNDKRAVCLAEKYIQQNMERLGEVPRAGERVQLVDIGTHSRGAVFLDGGHLLTPQFENELDRICRGYDGFYFGRFDIRARSFSDLQMGIFKIIELNGVTSESTNIYDPRYSLIDAYRILFRQWRLAFEIGQQNSQRGCRPATVRELCGMTFRSIPGEPAAAAN